jgi:hypothetical protein
MAAGRKEIANRLVLVSPLAQARAGVTTFGRLTGIPIQVLNRMQNRMEIESGVQFSECDLEALASSIHVPILTVHDTTDRMSAFEPVQLWANSHPEVEFLQTDEFGHQKILIANPVIERISSFLGKPRRGLRLDNLTEYAL